MNKLSDQPVIMIIAIVLFCSGITWATADDKTGEDIATVAGLNSLTDYPRIEHFEQGSVQVDFPGIDSWPDFRRLKAWFPVEVSLMTDSQPRVGSVFVQARTDINFDQRTVHISNLEVLETQIPGEQQPDTLRNLVLQAFQGRESIVPLDILLRLLPEDFEIPQQKAGVSRLNFDPPVILVSESPVKLLSIDKEPVRAPVEGTELEYVVNTNWNVFYYRPAAQWYVLNDNTWQLNNYLSNGGWVTTDKLPSDFDRLALNDNWQDVQKALPASKPSSPPLPFVISLEETELVLLDGAARLTVIDEAGVSYVSNTQSDLFSFGGRWYLLVSGRWFSNSELSGQWQTVRDLPDAFARIPSDHDKGHVLFSVPGTRQAKLALIEAALPHRVSVARDTGARIEVPWVGEPRFEVIDTTELQRGLNTPLQVIKHNNFYYLCHEGAWYFSESPTGGWKAALQIPAEIYRIPATDPAYNVTFVRLGAEQDESQAFVNYEYSGGYTKSFSTGVSVVYGTGWHYGQTYGYNTGYHPVGAYYGHRSAYWGGRAYWGPYGYGGWGGYAYPSRTTITIDSPAVNYTQGYGSAWEGPLQTTPGDPTKNTEKSLDQFLPRKESDGTETFVKTSKEEVTGPATVSASALYAGTALSSNRFSGPNGEVYKRDGQEWRQYSDGSWDTMKSMQQNQRPEPGPQQKTEPGNHLGYVPAHKKTLSRSELDRQELARLEGMDNYAKYRMQKENGQ